MISPCAPTRLSAGWPMIASTSRCVDCPGTRPRPSKLAQLAKRSRSEAKNQPPARLRLACPLDRGAATNPLIPAKNLLVLAGLGAEVLLEFVGFILVRIRVRRRSALACDVRPLYRELGVHFEPLLRLAV